jgi:hypothetical protein
MGDLGMDFVNGQSAFLRGKFVDRIAFAQGYAVASEHF